METKLLKLNPNWNKNPLTISKGRLENLSLKLLCNVIFPSLPDQFGIFSFTTSNFQLEEYPWEPNFSNYNKLKEKTSK